MCDRENVWCMGNSFLGTVVLPLLSRFVTCYVTILFQYWLSSLRKINQFQGIQDLATKRWLLGVQTKLNSYKQWAEEHIQDLLIWRLYKKKN